MKSVEDIQAGIKRYWNDTTNIQLRKRWDRDYDLFREVPYDAGSGFYSYTSNSARVLADKAISMLTDAKLIIRIPEDTLQEDEIEVANNIERFLYGVRNMNDDRLMLEPDSPSLNSLEAWYPVVRGTLAGRALILKEEDGSTFPEIAIWDIYNTAYARGRRGLAWAAHTRTASREEIKDTYGIDVGKREADIVDYWDTQDNIVYVNGKDIVNQWTHGLGYCPVHISRVGATPIVGHGTYNQTGLYVGESIYGPTRQLYPLLNRTISSLLTIVERGVVVPLGVWSAGGQRNLEEDIWQTDKAFAVPMDSTTGEKIEPLMEPTMPRDAKDMVDFVQGEIQRGGISHVA